jgi:hypothetical protein
MEDAGLFLKRLEEAVEKRREYLDTQRLPQIKEAFHSFEILFESILNMLINKGLLREDPYKYDQRISEISVPSDEPFLDSEKRDEVSYRLSIFRNQIDYLNSSYQFSLSFLDMPRLKRISALLGYISWKSLSDMAKSPTNRALAQYLGKIRMGTDSMAAGIIKDTLVQLEKVLRQITSVLAEAISFHRESFKCEVRARVLPTLGLDAASVGSRRDEALHALKRGFSQTMPGRPYYPELVEEILVEDFAPDVQSRRDALLERLAVREKKKEEVKTREEIPNKEVLLEAVRILSRVGPDLSSTLQVLLENHMLMSGRRMGLGERIRRWLARSVSRREEELLYEVEYFEGADPSPKMEKINFFPFTEGVRKKAALLSSLAGKAAGQYQKLEAADEDQVLEFLSKQISELHVIHRRMNSLNTHFLSEVPRETRTRLRGIKIQLTAIRNGIVKANQRKHEYVSRREEAEQMKRLGIT